MAPTTRVSNRDKHPGYIVRPGPYSVKKTAAKGPAIDRVTQEMDEDHAYEGEGEEATRPPAPSSAKVTYPSGTHTRNQLIGSKQGQKAAAGNGKPHEYKHMLKKEPKLIELVADTRKQYRLDVEEHVNEEHPELAQYGKRKQRVVYSIDSDNERPTSKKLKYDEHISQPVRGLHAEVLLPKWHSIVARDVHQTNCESYSEEKTGHEPAQANNVDHGGYDDEEEAVEEDEESNLIGQDISQRAPSEVSQYEPTNDLRRTSVNPPQNLQPGECHSGPGNGAGGVQRSTLPVSPQPQDTGTLPQVSQFQAHISASSAQQLAKKPHPRFRMEDLPDGSQQRFREELGPLWLDFISTLENPWDLTNHIDVLQEIWNMTFPDIEHTVQKTDDPVHFLLLQRASSYRCDIAKRGEIAVAAYLDSIGLKTPDEIAQHIGFLVPSVSETYGDEETVKCYPFMWREAKNIMNKDGRVERTETKGAFCSRPISDTFAHYLEIRECIPQALRQMDNPRGALALATVSVERALKMYSTGTYTKPKDGRQSRFSRKHWGVTTEEVMISVKKTTSRGWKKIIKAAIPYVRTRKSHHTSLRAALEKEREAPSGYTHCVDVDSGSDSGSEIII